MVFTLFGIHWAMPKIVVELLACWQGNFGHHRNGVIWMAVPHCLMWCIWRERNNRCFEDFERTIADLKLFFFKTLLDWMSIIGSHSIFSVYDLIDAWISFTYPKKKKKFCCWVPKANNLSSNKALELPAESFPFFHENLGKLHFTNLNYTPNYTLNPKLWMHG